jgi:hypothetical protein
MTIASLADLRPGDIMFGPIGGIVPGLFPVGVGQAILGETFHVGRLSIRHVGIVVEAGERKPLALHPNGPLLGFDGVGTAVTPPRLVQAMPHGAEEIPVREATHWTDRHAYVRLPEDYPGQAEDAAAIARLFVTERVAYSFASYAALAAWKYGLRTPRLEAWIGRRRRPVTFIGHELNDAGQKLIRAALPCEAICSVLADQAWTLAGRGVMQGVAHQAVTPGAMAGQLWCRPGTTWGGKGLAAQDTRKDTAA